MSWIAGVDGCKRGWVAAFRDLETERLQCGAFDTSAGLLDSDQRPTVVAVDMPIGLLEAGDRACDLEARSLVPGRGSSVFPAPIRPVLALDRYEEANALTRQVNGKGLSRQSFALVPKIREVDEELRARKAAHVWEAFPELAFVNMNDGKPLGHSKHNGFGLLERRNLLSRLYGPELERLELAASRLKGLALDALHDALALLETARRLVRGEACRVPDPPPLDRFGLPMQITF